MSAGSESAAAGHPHGAQSEDDFARAVLTVLLERTAAVTRSALAARNGPVDLELGLEERGQERPGAAPLGGPDARSALGEPLLALDRREPGSGDARASEALDDAHALGWLLGWWSVGVGAPVYPERHVEHGIAWALDLLRDVLARHGVALNVDGVPPGRAGPRQMRALWSLGQGAWQSRSPQATRLRVEFRARGVRAEWEGCARAALEGPWVSDQEFA